MYFDVLFVDAVCYKAYETVTLDQEPLGGTEATVIRVAEGLAAKGYKVGVLQHTRSQLSAGRHAFYLPWDMLPNVSAGVLVSLRGVAYLDQIPATKKISWQHDVPTHNVQQWPTDNIVYVCVSKWHEAEFLRLQPKAITYYIYNPVPDNLFTANQTKYDKNRLMWTASPHKGLAEALDTFKELQKRMPDARLHVYNPGYFDTKQINQQGVILEGAQPARVVWLALMRSLCVFYPTDFKETFGLIAAEANALHTPIATMPVAALHETVSTEKQLFTTRKELTEGVYQWYTTGRPIVEGQERFKTSRVIEQWIKLLEGMNT